MRRAAISGAVLAAAATVAVAACGLLGVEKLPVVEYLLWPGGFMAFAYRGDDYASGHEFLLYATAFGVPFNAPTAALNGVLVSAARKRSGNPG